MNRLNGLKLYLTCLILRRAKKKKNNTNTIYICKVQDMLSGFKTSLSYIADTAFFTLTVIKSCDLYHTDL